jgi:lathosterol oxidase
MTTPESLIDNFIAIWPTIFAVDLSRYLLTAGFLTIILAVFAGALASRRIQANKATAADIYREVFFSVITALLFSLVGFAVYMGSQDGIFKIYGGELPAAGRLLFEFIIVVLLHDTYFYWAHRMMHHRWLFRRVHRLHHKSRTPTPWAAYAFAPPEALLEAAILPLAALIVPMHELTAFLFVTHMIVRNVAGHAGIELFPSWWLRAPILRHATTTTHHDLHHSHAGYNFGLYFTWWDRWMNTEHPEYELRFMSAAQSRCSLSQTAKEVTK